MHTPGPWLYRGKSCAVYTAPPAGTKYSFGDHIFTFHDEEEPNGDDLDLILAAPELLEACRLFLAYNDGFDVNKGDELMVMYNQALTAAREAFAKATGGAA